MRARPRFFAAVLVALGLAVASGLPATPVPLGSVAEIRAVKEWPELQSHALALRGTVTLVDPARNLLVIQDGTGAVAVELGGSGLTAEPGQRVELTATEAWPYLPELPRYPRRPDRWEWPTTFESVPAAQQGYFVARFRGYVYPPVTGQYHFAIASDDSSHLMLGTDADPASRRGIAWVRGYTRERDWNRTPSQRSEAIFLQANQPYYIEVLHHQAGGATHLSVAWEGPNLPLGVIPGQYLSPWIPDPASAGPDTPTQTATAARRGSILREVWDDVTVDNPGLLSAPRTFESTLSVGGAAVKVLGPGPLPEPVSMHPGQPLSPEDNFRWAEVEGTVEFMARNGDQLVLELADGGHTVKAIVPGWRQEAPGALRGRRVRVAGVAEAVWDPAGDRLLGRMWLRPAGSIAVTQQSPAPDLSRRVTIAELATPDPAAFRDAAVKVVGRIVRQNGNELTISDSGTFAAFTSADGVDWHPLGPPVEIAMGPTVYVGLAVNSGSPLAQSHASFTQVTGLSPAPQRIDIGGPQRAGQVAVAGGRYDVTGVGSDIWDTPDQFTFVCEPLDGAGTIIARLDAFTPADPTARAGIMMRESLAPDAQYVDIVQTEPGRVRALNLQWRRRAEGSAPRMVSDYPGAEASPRWLKLERRFSSITVSAAGATGFVPGEMVDVAGYVAPLNGRPAIIDASVRKLWRELDAAPANRPWRPLVEIARLGDDARSVSDYDFFRIRGVVTFCDEVAGRRYWSVQDQSGSAFLLARDPSAIFQPRAGSYVEVHSNPGWSPPSNSLFADNVFVLGTAALPKPVRHPAEYLLPRRGEGAWIETEGIVRSVPADGLMEVKAKGEVFTVAVSGARVGRLREFVDASVRIRGVIAYPNERERLLLVPALEQLEAIDVPARDPFARTVEPVRALTAETLLNQSRHRTRIAGTITFVDRAVAYVQDETGAARVELETPTPVAIGTSVEAVGFPDWGEDDGAVLRHALLRVNAAGTPVVPETVNPGEASGGRLAARLIRVRAVVSRMQSTNDGETIELEADQRVFRAVLPGHRDPLDAIPRGSLVELTGVGVNESGLLQWIRASTGSSSILPLKVLLRSPADVVILQKPRWWAVKRTLIGLSAITLVAVLAVIWIQTLRRRVKQRTAELAATMEQLKKEAQMSATLAERDRLAGEIHDSLEQGFNGLLLQLEATAKLKSCAPEVRSGLALARNMVSFSRTEVQHAVWELQSPMLENSDLPVAIQKIAGQITPDTVHAVVRVEGTPRRLPSVIEHHLLRIVQEAINNTVKHANARKVDVGLRYESDAVSVSIKDDGCGFDPAQVRTGEVGHFGLRSLRSRANKIHGKMEIVSTPGSGTLVRVRVPTTDL